MAMFNELKTAFVVCIFSALCQTASADAIYEVTLDTSSLVGHPAGPFYVYATFTDGSGVGDANNTVTMSDFTFGGGSALGNPLVFGGASGSLETGITITDSSFFSFALEQFAPGLQLNFLLDLTLNDDSGGIPDRFSLSLLDSSGVALPTLAPSGDYFFGADIYSTGAIIDAYGSDMSRSLSVGGPVSIPVPTITSVSSVPEPSTIYLLGGALAMTGVLRHRLTRSGTKGKATA
jgi:hypothetical protein